MTRQFTTSPLDDDHLREECGVFGIFGHAEAAAHTVLGLHALQHRGQEAAGIVSFDGRHFNAHRELGLVADRFSAESVVARLRGHAAIGHTRYATTGETILRNVQPLFADLEFGGFAIAHNGNLTNAYALRRELVRRGSLFQSTTDTEVITHLMATSPRGNAVDRLIDALRRVEGAYSLVALADDMVIGVRDPLGVRPLSLGRPGPLSPRARGGLRLRHHRRRVRPLYRGRRAGRPRQRRLPSPAPIPPRPPPLLHLRAYLFRPPRQHRRRHQRVRGEE